MNSWEARHFMQETSRRMSALEKAISDQAQKQHEAALAAQQEQVKQTMIEILSKVYDKASAYTNLIMLGGYAGAFAIWTTTRGDIPLRANIVVALSLGSSLTAFVLFEIYKMIMTGMQGLRMRSVLIKPLPPAEFLKNIQEAGKREAALPLAYIPIWILVLVISVLGALTAISILFYNYFALLIGWPLWPS